MRLSNTEVELSLIQQQTALYNLAAQNQIATNAALQNTVNKRNTLTDAESALREAKRVYELDSVLYTQKAIGSQEYRKAANDYKTALQKQQLNSQIMAQDSLSTVQQARSNETSYKGSAKALDVMNHKVGDLIVVSPMDGQLTSLDAEIGQSKKQGDRLGQIDTLKGYKVRVEVDEHYLSRIYTDLKGTFDFAGASYKLKIIKVFSQITAGHFQVDMTFVGDAPKGIRRGQTLQILLALSDERQAVLVPRGGFYQQTGGNWIFKVSADGKMAYRADIQLGNQNPEFYEVLSGLAPGDKVVTSSYENYGTMQELVIKK
jgi:HlyD family secretion protein